MLGPVQPLEYETVLLSYSNSMDLRDNEKESLKEHNDRGKDWFIKGTKVV